MTYEEDLVAYQERRRTAKPKFRLVCFEPSSLGYWGAVSYSIGALLYNIGDLNSMLCAPMQCGPDRRKALCDISQAAPLPLPTPSRA